jgi:hypothetical protein
MNPAAALLGRAHMHVDQYNRDSLYVAPADNGSKILKDYMAAGDADDDSASSEALKQMFGLSVKDEEELTPPEIVYESETDEAEGTQESESSGKSSSYPSPKSGGDSGSDR